MSSFSSLLFTKKLFLLTVFLWWSKDGDFPTNLCPVLLGMNLLLAVNSASTEIILLSSLEDSGITDSSSLTGVYNYCSIRISSGLLYLLIKFLPESNGCVLISSYVTIG